MNNDIINPPYRSVRDAIRAAYASEVAEVIGRTPTVTYRAGPKTDGPDGPVIGDMLIGSAIQERASGVRSNGQAPFEAIAEGVWAMSLIRDTLPDDLMAVVDAKFTLMGDPLLELRKYAATVRVAGTLLRLGIYGPPDYDYTIATVAEWAGFGALNRKAWEAHLGFRDRTFDHWRYGRGFYGVGIDARLRVCLAEAVDTLAPAMVERGLVFGGNRPKCDNYSKGRKKGSAMRSGLLRLRKRTTHDQRTSKVAADIPDDGHGHEAEYRLAG